MNIGWSIVNIVVIGSQNVLGTTIPSISQVIEDGVHYIDDINSMNW